MSDSEARERFVEHIGQLTEAEGLPRIAGRIFGLLMVSSSELTLDEIADQLSVSRASVSTDARRLSECGLLQRVTRKGDRRDYYKIASDHFSYMLERRISATQRMTSAFALGLELEGLPDDVVERLNKTHSIISWLMARAVQDLVDFRKEFLPSSPSHDIANLLATLGTHLASRNDDEHKVEGAGPKGDSEA